MAMLVYRRVMAVFFSSRGESVDFRCARFTERLEYLKPPHLMKSLFFFFFFFSGGFCLTF